MLVVTMAVLQQSVIVIAMTIDKFKRARMNEKKFSKKEGAVLYLLGMVSGSFITLIITGLK